MEGDGVNGMRRGPQGVMPMQMGVFLAQMFVQAKCGRMACIHMEEKERESEWMKKSNRQNNRQPHRLWTDLESIH